MRFLNSDTRLNQIQTQILHEECPLLYNKNGEIIPAGDIYFDPLGGLTMSINLDQDIVGYKCSPSGAKVIDFNKFDHDPEEFFETMPRPRNGHIVLSRDSFYILSTIEYIRVPLNYAVEMIAYDTSKGEFRSHYAGFFDPGWGYGQKGERFGSPAVLEVITYDNDFILRHGQPICKMVYERLAEQADISYGSGETKSNYHEQTGPKLSKHFRDYKKNNDKL
jgi:dCTP deaminase